MNPPEDRMMPDPSAEPSEETERMETTEGSNLAATLSTVPLTTGCASDTTGDVLNWLIELSAADELVTASAPRAPAPKAAPSVSTIAAASTAVLRALWGAGSVPRAVLGSAVTVDAGGMPWYPKPAVWPYPA